MALSSESVSSTHQYGCDMTIRVKNMSKVYTRGCTSDMYAKFVSDVAYIRAMAQLNIPAQEHSNYSVEVTQTRVEVKNPAFAFIECRLLHEQEQDPQFISQSRWMKSTVHMKPNSTHNFGYLFHASKYDQYIIVFISPRDTVTHLQFLLVKVGCNNTGQELVVYGSKKKYNLCRLGKVGRRLVARMAYAFNSTFVIAATLTKWSDGFQASVTTKRTVEPSVTYDE
ncbi:unnamed protein product [Soboliphyme baturini]|uniref:ZP domain-containing protein n=1 Tax=Soboliphyme baturini TaxID=241478 RepID=A0A183IYL4_9BILA|nr:unnamed protein product [Soboliphyme baturini]